MPTNAEAFDLLQSVFEFLAKAVTDCAEANKRDNKRPGSVPPEILKDLDRIVIERQGTVRRVLADCYRYPPIHERHFGLLGEFHQTADFQHSVLIMTKYPEGEAEVDAQLRRVIDAVKTAVSDSGFVPRLAADRDYHPQLWDNVELYLLGSGRGIAILEDIYRTELNPNVAMEWGWMRALAACRTISG